MKPREARVATRRDVADRKAHRIGAAILDVEFGPLYPDLLTHPWHEPTLEELEGVARARVARYVPDLRGDWDGLNSNVQRAEVDVARGYVADVVGLTAVRVLEQAAERADAEDCPKVAAWLRSLSQEVEV